MKTYGYYPGCSVRSTSKAYEKSLLGVFKALNLELKELKDWNCCGATAYFGVDKDMAMAVSGATWPWPNSSNSTSWWPPARGATSR